MQVKASAPILGVNPLAAPAQREGERGSQMSLEASGTP
jgi:hypothetical protein